MEASNEMAVPILTLVADSENSAIGGLSVVVLVEVAEPVLPLLSVTVRVTVKDL